MGLDMKIVAECYTETGSKHNVTVATWRKAYAVHEWLCRELDLDTQDDACCVGAELDPKVLERLITACYGALDDDIPLNPWETVDDIHQRHYWDDAIDTVKLESVTWMPFKLLYLADW